MKFSITSGASFNKQSANRSSVDGFTMIELAVVVALIGALAAIAAPGWTRFLAVRQLEVAQDEVFQAMRSAQGNAKRSHLNWQFSVQESAGVVQWAVHPAGALPTAGAWQSLAPNVFIDSDETTLQTTGGVRRVRFDYEGNVSGQLGRLSLQTKLSDKKLKRCVIVSTLIGVVRKGQDHTTKENGKSCY